MLSIPVFSVYCCTARPVNFTLPSSQTSFTVTWKYIRGTADAWLKKKMLAIMKTGYAGNYLYLPKCFEREISAYLYCYSWCMHILHTATQGPKSTNYLKQQEKVNDIYSDFGFVVRVISVGKAWSCVDVSEQLVELLFCCSTLLSGSASLSYLIATLYCPLWHQLPEKKNIAPFIVCKLFNNYIQIVQVFQERLFVTRSSLFLIVAP